MHAEAFGSNHLASKPGGLYKRRMRQEPGTLSTGSGLGAILLWSATFAVARSLSEQVGPLTAGATAYLIGGAGCRLLVAGSLLTWGSVSDRPPSAAG